MIFAALNRYDKIILSAICWYMLYRVSEGFSDLLQGMLQKNSYLDTAGICLTVKAFITTIAFISVFYSTNSLNLALCTMTISALAVTFLFEFQLTHKVCCIKIKAEWGKCKKLFKETMPLLIHLLLISIMLNMPKYAISLTYSEKHLGIYASVFSVSQIIQAIFQYIYTPFLTSFSKLYCNGKTKEIRILAVKILFAFIMLILAFISIMELIGTPVLIAIFGKEIEHYDYMILPAILSVCAYCTMCFACILEIIMRKFYIMLVSQLTGVFTGIICTFFLLEFAGINGVSYGMTIGSVVALIIMLGHIKFRVLK